MLNLYSNNNPLCIPSSLIFFHYKWDNQFSPRTANTDSSSAHFCWKTQHSSANIVFLENTAKHIITENVQLFMPARVLLQNVGLANWSWTDLAWLWFRDPGTSSVQCEVFSLYIYIFCPMKALQGCWFQSRHWSAASFAWLILTV